MKNTVKYALIAVAVFAFTGVAFAADIVRDYFAAEARFQAAEAAFLQANASREAALHKVQTSSQIVPLSTNLGSDLEAAVAKERAAAQKELKAAEEAMSKAEAEKSQMAKELERLKGEILKEDSTRMERIEKKLDRLLEKMGVDK